MKNQEKNANVDPFFFDSEAMARIAEESAIRDGLAFFKDHRVLDMGHDPVARVLWGSMEHDNEEMLPHETRIELDENANLVYRCSCGNCDTESACLHVVALLLSYSDQVDETDRLMTATDMALRDRIKRGRSEVRVEPVTESSCFGEWRAWSVTSTTHFPMKYTVTVRSLNRRANICTCPDFANNQLGTCKHIEAVLHNISKRPDFQELRKAPPPFAYVYLLWESSNGPFIRLGRRGAAGDEIQPLLNSYFDSDGVFKRRIPEDFFRFSQDVEERPDIHVGHDVLQHVRHLASIAAREARVAEIRGILSSTRGRIPGIHAKLYPYQVEGVAFLAGTGRALLADDMGLGKTLQAISAAVWLREHEGAKKTFIICPASLKHQWAREIERFSGLDCQIIQGPPETRAVQYRRDCAFFIANYELVLRDLSVINEMLAPDLMILDEAQRIKNWRTKIANAVKLIQSRYAFVLSGTPLENRLEDLYSLMQVVDPRILGPLWRYMVDFHVTDERGKVLGYRNLSVLRRRIAPVMLRRDRRLVHDQLPDRIVKKLSVAMTPKQMELHDSAMQAAGTLSRIALKRPLTPTEQNRLMAALQQARMACNAAGLVDKETEGSPKIDELAAIIEEFCIGSGLKAVVFSQWEAMTRMVEARLHSMNVGFVRLHGGVPTAKRGELMERFREDDSVQVFVSTDAGGTGLNLQSGSVLVNLDMPWNPAVLEQRNARVHRLGQKRKVLIINMVSADSYEEHVLKLVSGKQNLFDNVISEDATEDVVGISKKLLETIVDDLANDHDVSGRRPSEEREEDEHGKADFNSGESKTSKKGDDDKLDQAVTQCVKEIQREFGPRIERILGAGGGVMVVLDYVDPRDDEFVRELSDQVPVAVIDQRTLSGLERLSGASPVTSARVIYEPEDQNKSDGSTSRLARVAEEKFRAAAILVEQQCMEGAVELLLSSLLAAAGARADLDTPPSPETAGVWLYEKAVPSGIVDQDEAALIMRAMALAQAPSVPEGLLRELVDDVDVFVND